eukprot:TRINITY_DN38150_c0_g1_i2.p1 TRINITY_DN38150_c0_g1~~TRINITY_DN38150_c0_g1_i2.p1  ORF type:complete len:530 (+),score=69.88 TRINITY_DN38150_c0_g1_i2:43-1632(+)
MGARLCPAGDDIAPETHGVERVLLREIVHPLFGTLLEPQVKAPTFLDESIARYLRPARHPEDVSSSSSGCESYPEHVQSMLLERSQRMLQELLKGRTLGGHREQAVVTVPDEPVESVLASLSLALVRANMEGIVLPSGFVFHVSRRRIRQPLLAAWKDWQERARGHECAGEDKLPQEKAGSYNWLKEDNSALSRLERLACAFLWLRQVLQHASVPTMVRGTRLITPFRLRPSPRCQCTSLTYCAETVVAAAARQTRQGCRVVAVNAASAYQVGGGFLSGGRHALEEAMCMQSTLYASLQQASRIAAAQNLRDERGQRVHIPEHGAVLSPGVWILRGGTSDGYASCSQGEICLAGVVSVAMPNVNSSNRSSPVDRRSREAREMLIERKFHAIFQAAAMVHADVLVVPDIGCGVFGNSPTVVGAAMGRVLCAYRGYFSEIVFTGNEEFYFAATGAAGPNFVTCLGDSCLDVSESASVCGESCGQFAFEMLRSVSGLPTRPKGFHCSKAKIQAECLCARCPKCKVHAGGRNP